MKDLNFDQILFRDYVLEVLSKGPKRYSALVLILKIKFNNSSFIREELGEMYRNSMISKPTAGEKVSILEAGSILFKNGGYQIRQVELKNKELAALYYNIKEEDRKTKQEEFHTSTTNANLSRVQFFKFQKIFLVINVILFLVNIFFLYLKYKNGQN